MPIIQFTLPNKTPIMMPKEQYMPMGPPIGNSPQIQLFKPELLLFDAHIADIIAQN